MSEITTEMLHAFVDGELSLADAERVEEWLNTNPEAAAELANWAEQNAAIRELFPHRETPPALPRPAEPANIQRAPAGYWPALAAACLFGAVGLGTGWFARGTQSVTSDQVAVLVSEAIAAHGVYSIDPHRPVEVAASEEETLIRWLSNRVGTQLSAPDLTSQGYTLVGGRLLSVTDGPAAQFMYEDADGDRITLFATHQATGTPQLASFQFNEANGERSFYWEDGDLTYAIVGAVDRDTLSTLASSVFNQL